MKNTLYEGLNNLYPVSKTLRFELIPQGKTLENIQMDQIIEEDSVRNISYQNIKKLIDEYHKLYISQQLCNYKLNGLDEYSKLFYDSNLGEKESAIKEKIEEGLRKQIVQQLTKSDRYKNLSKKEMITTYLIDYLESQNRLDELVEVEQFKTFTTYFTGFFENRKHIYSKEAKSGTLAYRLINENLPLFLNNMKTFQKIKELKADLLVSDDSFDKLTQGIALDRYFELSFFNETLTQKGIEAYNHVLNGEKSDDNQIEGLNNYINKYNQKVERNERIPRMNVLRNQILAEHSSYSFKFDDYVSDDQLVTDIENLQHLYNEYCIKDESNNITTLLMRIADFDLSKVYINSKNLKKLSNDIFKDWSVLIKTVELIYDSQNLKSTQKINEKYIEKRNKSLKKAPMYPLEQIIEYVGLIDKNYPTQLLEFFSNIESIKSYYQDINRCFENLKDIIENVKPDEKELLKKEKEISLIKEYLDVMKDYQEHVKGFAPVDMSAELDMNFYASILEMNQVLEFVDVVYNKARNYLTKKPFSTQKMKLNFRNSTLLDGWDLNKENDNSGMLFKKDNIYYLGIYRKGNRDLFEKPKGNKNDVYQKIIYKLLPGPNKMLPKVFFSEKRRSYFEASDELYNKYKNGCHLKNDGNFDIDFCHELIDFFKQSISIHEDWKHFDFVFQNTNKYKDISEFYKEVADQAYKITFQNIPSDYLTELVDEGKLYFFKIYNKDFSEYSHGKPNLHTIYWKALFDENNLKDVIYKLNGQAEVFYRRASLSLAETPIHYANEEIENKNNLNEKKHSKFSYDLIKNKRYTEDKFFFHVPLTMNFKCKNNLNINENVNENISKYNDIHVIGIDRGERNLIYISVIDEKGSIIKQESLNSIISTVSSKNKKECSYQTDYHKLLADKEDARDKARKSWKTIENIKELKEGYISQVVNRVIQLMFEYDAIVVLEDLNFGFKNSRIKIDKQVYQKFEKQLISKLNYLIFKDKKIGQDGHFLRPYQLTNKFESFSKLGKQSGILFYIPAWKTSKLDPVTGFADQIYIKHESINKSQQFFSNFADIRYNEAKKYYEFVIDDYAKFTNRSYGMKKNWVLCTYGNRIRTFRDQTKNSNWNTEEINLSEQFTNLFNTYQIDMKNIKKSIIDNKEGKFFDALMSLMKLLLQMRNSVPNSNVDYLISSVCDKNGVVFDSRLVQSGLPLDADANGAYNIARKGLMLIKQIRASEDKKKVKWNLTNHEYLSFVQSMHWEK